MSEYWDEFKRGTLRVFKMNVVVPVDSKFGKANTIFFSFQKILKYFLCWTSLKSSNHDHRQLLIAMLKVVCQGIIF